jgi:hypothetical protein
MFSSLSTWVSEQFKSDAEKQVDAMYKPSVTPTATEDLSLSWWDKVKESIVPESYGESLVREIYGSTPARTLQRDPVYNPEDFSSPNAFVRGKAALSDAASALSGFGTKAAIIGVIVLLLVVIAYAGTTAFVRR